MALEVFQRLLVGFNALAFDRLRNVALREEESLALVDRRIAELGQE